jgi:16S rRNA (uracil1498-N3)-methyltransferase
VRVSRVRPGDIVALLDGRGTTYEVRVARMDAREASCEVVSRHRARTGPPVDIALAVIRAPRLELAVEKCTELGIRKMIPFIAERGLWRGGDEGARLKVERIRRKVIASCKQSGQPFFPEIAPPVSLEELAEQIPSYAAVFLAEQHATSPTGMTSEAGASPTLGIVGPEGGLTPGERGLLVAKGAVPLSLGPFRLRSETAAICLSYRLLIGSHELAQE